MEVRLDFHKIAESYKFTAKADDCEVFFKIRCQEKLQALAIEKHIKSMKSKILLKIY